MGATMAKRRQKQVLAAKKKKEAEKSSGDKAQAENLSKGKKGK
jgi:hypothetical protein